MNTEVMNQLLQEAGLPTDHPLAQRLRMAFDRLSPGQQRVARLLLESPYDVAFLPVADVGRRANVSDSTVVRLASELGYSGYPELRQELQRQKFPRALVIICGNKRGLANQYLRRHVLPVRASVQLPASFSPDPELERRLQPFFPSGSAEVINGDDTDQLRLRTAGLLR